MKTLHLLRHAKSSWKDAALPDIDRPLNRRGLRASAAMAKALQRVPGFSSNVVCSPARRAQQTLENISARLPASLHWQTDAALYTFDASDLLDWLQALDASVDSVTLVGHNPALTDLCNRLGDTAVANLPTCGYARLKLPITSWQTIHSAQGKLDDLIRPKDLDL